MREQRGQQPHQCPQRAGSVSNGNIIAHSNNDRSSNRSSAATDDQGGNTKLAQCLNQEFERAQQVLNQRQ